MEVCQSSPSSTAASDEHPAGLAESEGECVSSVSSDGQPVHVQTRKAAADWRLVWCHERCFKDESTRAAISHLVDQRGGLLTSIKKAKTFETKFLSAHPSPFVLLTDGREIKPCMEAIAQQPVHRPFQVFALVENAKHAARVAGWFRDSRHPQLVRRIHVIQDIGRLGGILDDALRKFRTAQQAHTMWGSGSPTARPEEIRCVPLQCCTPWPTSAGAAAPETGDATRGHLVRQQHHHGPAVRAGALQQPGIAGQVGIGAAWAPAQAMSPKQVEHMLVAAMPQNYEE
eukprot:CAMPEP_0198509928 /NCGR_PEP_ID=MMETSP1462-20131121/13870_1 /TAXON_ID=1333877 /ORGANISM="Brandtodinium nutriculum, Strain RCC3387" /LENGTH=285 /DNA_ID=CAMNT_0044239249 /DNA_START=63 /DNA_END=920 /DNA_ORIENTATION=-